MAASSVRETTSVPVRTGRGGEVLVGEFLRFHRLERFREEILIVATGVVPEAGGEDDDEQRDHGPPRDDPPRMSDNDACDECKHSNPIRRQGVCGLEMVVVAACGDDPPPGAATHQSWPILTRLQIGNCVYRIFGCTRARRYCLVDRIA